MISSSSCSGAQVLAVVGTVPVDRAMTIVPVVLHRADTAVLVVVAAQVGPSRAVVSTDSWVGIGLTSTKSFLRFCCFTSLLSVPACGGFAFRGNGGAIKLRLCEDDHIVA